MLDTAVPAASSVIAFVTAVHAALLVVHLERVRGLLRLAAALPCVAFAALAWVLTTPPWLAAGVAANLAWTIAVSVVGVGGGTAGGAGAAGGEGAGSAAPVASGGGGAVVSGGAAVERGASVGSLAPEGASGPPVVSSAATSRPP
jgi:hypothetical protein